METSFMLIPLLYIAGMIAVAIVVVLALWRIMKAQEATARALKRIADSFDSRSR